MEQSNLLMALFILTVTGLGAVLWFGFRGLLKSQGDLKDQLTSIDKNVALSKQAFEMHLREDERHFKFLNDLVISLAKERIDASPDA